MNTFWFEFKKLARPAILWIITLVAFTGLFILGVFPIYEKAGDELRHMVNNFPPVFRALFGMENSMFSISGFLSFGFIYFALIGVIFSSLLMLIVFQREKKNKTQDFLLTKPRKRTEIFWAKYGAAFCWIFLGSICYVSMYLYGVHHVSTELKIDGRLVLSAFMVPLLMVFFGSIGALIGVFVRRIRTVSGTAVLFGMVGYLMSAVYSLMDKKGIRFFSPFKYIDLNKMIRGEDFGIFWILLPIFLTILFSLFAWMKYTRTDIPAA